jgi:drug/metabolite transporter (DMT)-like permease
MLFSDFTTARRQAEKASSLNTPPVSSDHTDAAASRRRAAIEVAACTIFGAAAQILFKIAMSPGHFVPTLVGLATNLPLIVGYFCYGIFTIVLVLALRQGELSMLYPIISLTYVWVTIASYLVLHEPPNLYKNAGVLTIVIGVAIIGGGGKK